MIGVGSREPESRRRRRTTTAIAPATGSNTAHQNQAGTLRRCRSGAGVGADAFEATWPSCGATPGVHAGEVRVDCFPCGPRRSTVFSGEPARVADSRTRRSEDDPRTGDETAPRAAVTSVAPAAPSGEPTCRRESRAEAEFGSFVSVDDNAAAAGPAACEEPAVAGPTGAEAAGGGGAEAAGAAGGEGGADAAAAVAAGLGAAGSAGWTGRNRSGST
jgi:hypothetical protein